MLRGQGIPALHGGRRGDLKVLVNVLVPRRLDAEQRRAVEALDSTLGEQRLRGRAGRPARPRCAALRNAG